MRSDAVTTDPTLTQFLGVAGAVPRGLSIEVSDKSKNHVLDTITAMVSGSRLRPGKPAIDFIASQWGASSPS
jgi:hypothetical protein